ncbi:MAG TPA: PDZ domain-containing protein [Chitinophagaceae bacterium]|nr:PDZ domain-containing protein [Chitinophagaceae bacterium]
MKKYLLKASGIAVMAAMLSASVFAQDDKGKDRNKLGKNDEIVIIKKGDKDARITIEVRDGEVTVNGRPIDEYKDDDVIVRRGRSALNNARVYSPSPFRGQAWSFNDNEERAYLGVSTEKHDDGARITNVSDNTAAEKAGLKEGDIITRVDDTRIEDHDDLSAAIRKHKPDEKVTVTYLRDGREQKTTATLGKTGYAMTFATPEIKGLDKLENLNEHFNFDNFGQTFSYNGRGRLGIRAQDTEDGNGVKVLDVDDGSAADKAGIRAGDIITEFDGKDVNSADALANAARASKDKSSMSVRLNRDGRSQTVEVRIPKKLKTTNL